MYVYPPFLQLMLVTYTIRISLSLTYLHYQKTLEYSSLENSYLHQTMGQWKIS